jgi:ribosomal-protein-alanine N-acetyltransferase
MLTNVKTSVRTAGPQDRRNLATLIHFEFYIHRHLDWRPPLDWLGSQPYLIFEKNGIVAAALACPPDPPRVAWIRLFAVSSRLTLDTAWNSLWPAALEKLQQMPDVVYAAAIPLQGWFESHLIKSGFEQTHRVVMLKCNPARVSRSSSPPGLIIRPMNLDDLPAVEVVDHAAFKPVWQNSQEALELAFRQAAVATVGEIDDQLIAYQISTSTPMGGHLARLAVHPQFQKRHIGLAMVEDMLAQFEKRGARAVTVNTQQDNSASLALYERIGFRRTGEEYPVYQYTLQSQDEDLR